MGELTKNNKNVDAPELSTWEIKLRDIYKKYENKLDDLTLRKFLSEYLQVLGEYKTFREFNKRELKYLSVIDPIRYPYIEQTDDGIIINNKLYKAGEEVSIPIKPYLFTKTKKKAKQKKVAKIPVSIDFDHSRIEDDDDNIDGEDYGSDPGDDTEVLDIDETDYADYGEYIDDDENITLDKSTSEYVTIYEEKEKPIHRRSKAVELAKIYKIPGKKVVLEPKKYLKEVKDSKLMNAMDIKYKVKSKIIKQKKYNPKIKKWEEGKEKTKYYLVPMRKYDKAVMDKPDILPMKQSNKIQKPEDKPKRKYVDDYFNTKFPDIMRTKIISMLFSAFRKENDVHKKFDDIDNTLLDMQMVPIDDYVKKEFENWSYYIYIVSNHKNPGEPKEQSLVLNTEVPDFDKELVKTADPVKIISNLTEKFGTDIFFKNGKELLDIMSDKKKTPIDFSQLDDMVFNALSSMNKQQLSFLKKDRMQTFIRDAIKHYTSLMSSSKIQNDWFRQQYSNIKLTKEEMNSLYDRFKKEQLDDIVSKYNETAKKVFEEREKYNKNLQSSTKHKLYSNINWDTLSFKKYYDSEYNKWRGLIVNTKETETTLKNKFKDEYEELLKDNYDNYDNAGNLKNLKIYEEYLKIAKLVDLNLTESGFELAKEIKSLETAIYNKSSETYDYLSEFYKIFVLTDKQTYISKHAKYFKNRLDSGSFKISKLSDITIYQLFPEFFANKYIDDNSYSMGIKLFEDMLQGLLQDFIRVNYMKERSTYKQPQKDPWVEYNLLTEITQIKPGQDAIICYSEENKNFSALSLKDIQSAVNEYDKGGKPKNPYTGEYYDIEVLNKMKNKYL